MHIQDGYLSAPVCLATAAVSLGAVSYSVSKLKGSLADRTIPMTGMMASLVFAGQMVNFPIGLPVSGHLLGGVLAASIVGPWAGCIAITMVLVVQWALFSDGGLMSLGANVLHMGVVGSLGGYAVMSFIRRRWGGGLRGTVIGAVVAAWLSVLAAAALFCVEFRLSHASQDFAFQNIFLWMIGLHALIGLGEALITGSIVSLVCQQRPDLIHASAASSLGQRVGRCIAFGMMVSLAIGAFLAPFASELPDGLDEVATRFSMTAAEDAVPGVFAEYGAVPVPIDGWQGLSVSLAGIVGTLIVFGLALALGRVIPGTTQIAEAARE